MLLSLTDHKDEITDRALCGALAIGAAVMGWDILIEAADVPAVLVFVGPIGLVGLLSVMPWGLRKHAPAV